MNKLYAILGVLLLTVSSVSAQKSGTDSRRASSGESVAIETITRDSLGIDTLRRIDAVDNGLLTLRSGGRDGSMMLEVAGFGLRLGQTPMQKMETKLAPFQFKAITDMELGFTQLTGVDYAGYTPQEEGFLDQKLGSSFHFSFSVVQMRLLLNRSRTLSLGLGLQYTLDNIRFADSGITLDNVGRRLMPVVLDEPADKSKIVTSSLGIPVRLIYEPVRHFRISAVAYSDFMLGADAIYKKPKEKHSLSGFRTYQFGVGVSVSYYGLGFYTRYGITPLFKSGAGPDCHAVSFGIVCLL